MYSVFTPKGYYFNTMSQIKQVSETLKQLLRQSKITYKQLAHKLDMSEANIKRIFSTNSFSLERIEQICQIVEISLSELFLLIENQQEKLNQLSEEQERELVSDPKLLLVAVCVGDSWKFEDIVQHYNITEHECFRLMAKLDRLKMIQLLPHNNYKLLITQDFRWIKDGPLEQFMAKDVLKHFMASNFDSEDSFRFYLRGSYSQSSLEILHRKLNQLTKEAGELHREDSNLPLSKRKHVGVLIAMRPWELSLFRHMRRKKEAREKIVSE